jgi:DNA-binding transcriptional LysR family regulator
MRLEILIGILVRAANFCEKRSISSASRDVISSGMRVSRVKFQWLCCPSDCHSCLPLADSPNSLIGMVAARRGVFVAPEVVIRVRQEAWRSAGDFYLLTEPDSDSELYAIWKKQSRMEPVISKFIDVLVAELKSP